MLDRVPRSAWTVVAAAALAASPWACGSAESTPGYQSLGGGGGEGGDGSGGDSTTSSSKAASSSSKAASSSHASSGSSSSSSSSASSSASSSGAGGAMCDDTGVEPNEDEASAANLGVITDCDGTGSLTKGVLADAGDVDWFKYTATDELGCVVDPNRGLTVSGTVRLCKFIDCVSGTADVTCPAGTSAETSPGGLPGCCGSDDFSESMDCDGIDDDATVFIRLDQASDACAKYTLTYHY